MAIEIKNELRAAAIVSVDDGEKVIQIFGMTFVRTGVGVYVFTMSEDVDPSQFSIWATTGINELTQPRGRFTNAKTLEVRSYLPDGTPADCRVLFVEVHRYPGVLGNSLPSAPPIPTPGAGGGRPIIPEPLIGVLDVDWTNIPTAGTQLQDTGIDIVLPAGTYSLLEVAGRMVNGISGGEPGMGDFQGVLVFDSAVGDPSARFVVAKGSFVGADLNGFGFSQFTVAADGSLSLALSNVGGATNFVRMALAVTEPIPIPFSIPGP